MPKPTLTEADFQDAAIRLSVSVAAVKAVCEVEAPRGGFLPTGEPTILFERHIFHRLTKGVYDAVVPDLSNAKPGGYGKTAEQHGRLQRATELDRSAALQSASWGKFQIMGFNYARAGFADLQSFINAMYAGEREQLMAFVAFVQHGPHMVRALQERNWAQFAFRYNGPNYAINKYDHKLAAAYEKYA